MKDTQAALRLIKQLLYGTSGNTRKFLKSLNKFYKENNYLTEKQMEAVFNRAREKFPPIMMDEIVNNTYTEPTENPLDFTPWDF